MFFIFSILMFLILSGISFLVMNLSGNVEVFGAISVIALVMSIVFLISGFFINLAQWDIQIKRFEEIRKIKKLLILKKKQFEELKNDWIKYLSVQYPDFEKDVFSKMSPQEKTDLQMYFVKYPELNTSGMLNSLILNINEMSNKIYSLDSDAENTSSYIRSQLQNKWLLIKPEIPSDIKEMVYRNEDNKERV